MPEKKLDTIEFMMATQSAMAESMASTNDTLANMAKTLVTMQVDQGKQEERIINILEDNHSRDTESSRLGQRVRNLENAESVTRHYIKYGPKVFWSMIGALGVGATAMYAFIELLMKGQ